MTKVIGVVTTVIRTIQKEGKDKTFPSRSFNVIDIIPRYSIGNHPAYVTDETKPDGKPVIIPWEWVSYYVPARRNTQEKST